MNRRSFGAAGAAIALGMEHGISQPGTESEQRLIQAYREVDDFEV